MSRFFLQVSFFGLLLLAFCVQQRHRLVGEIVDADNQQTLAASVSITDESGTPLEIEGEHSHVQYLGQQWCYVDGTFLLTTSKPRVLVKVRRGPETLPLEEVVEVSGRLHTFRLRRWINMQEQGYLSGDSHVHYLSLKDSHLQMRAENLNVLNLLTSDFTNDLEKFTGQLDPISTPGQEVYVGQEFRDWDQGHICLLGISSIIEPLKPFGGRGERNLLLARAMRDARNQGGVVAWAHFSNLPGAESAIDIALGLVDAIELITYDDPTELPSHWGPWANSGMSQAEFTVMRGLDLYYQYLNAGFRLPIVAGTDKMGENIPVGSNRLYSRVGGEPNYDAWLAGVKAGNGFVTNGPVLTFEVDSHTIGEVVEFNTPGKVTAKARARSILPFSRLEIVLNGKPVAVTTVESSKNREENGIYATEVTADIKLNQSCWVAARVVQVQGSRQRILPRELTVFAHTNPVYFLRNGAKVRDEASIRYLRKYIRGTLHWLTTGARFSNPEVKAEALRLAEKARRIYESL